MLDDSHTQVISVDHRLAERNLPIRHLINKIKHNKRTNKQIKQKRK